MASAVDPSLHCSDSLPPPRIGEIARGGAAIGEQCGGSKPVSAVEVLFLSKEDVDSLTLSPEEILATVEMGFDAHGRNDVLLPSKDHIPLGWPQNIFKG